jgi:[ribosomal protein S5]-alanine N-acetyltransferase
MLSFNFSPFPVLATSRLVLRQTTQNDVAEVFFLRRNAEILRYVDRDPCQSLVEAAEFIDKITAPIINNEAISWAICLKETDKQIGDIALWKISKEHHRAEIGYCLHPHYQGQGLMSEALAAVLEYAFSMMLLHSIEANTNPKNKASQKLLERAGFVQEAYMRENYYYNGRFLDSAIYSLIRPANVIEQLSEK